MDQQPFCHYKGFIQDVPLPKNNEELGSSWLFQLLLPVYSFESATYQMKINNKIFFSCVNVTLRWSIVMLPYSMVNECCTCLYLSVCFLLFFFSLFVCLVFFSAANELFPFYLRNILLAPFFQQLIYFLFFFFQPCLKVTLHWSILMLPYTW